MPTNALQLWWQNNWKGLLCGLAAGSLWGFTTAGSATPRDPLVYDMVHDLVYEYSSGSTPTVTPAEQFFFNFNATLIQITLILLVVSGAAGWATWQLLRLKPRGHEQPALRPGFDWYVIALMVGGLFCVLAFRLLNWAVWFRGPEITPLAAITAFLQILLPLYMGIALFLVWLLRLKSIRAPDWDTHFPKPMTGPNLFSRWRRKGGGRQKK